MALNDDIDDIKTNIGRIAFALAATEVAIQHLSDKIDGIKSNGGENTLPNPRIFAELLVIFRLLAAGKKIEAIMNVRRLTDCGLKEANSLVEIIDVANHD